MKSKLKESRNRDSRRMFQRNGDKMLPWGFFIFGRDSGGAIKKESLNDLYKVPWTIFADEST
jgi:Ca2+-binding EF-hand superfamily protein